MWADTNRVNVVMVSLKIVQALEKYLTDSAAKWLLSLRKEGLLEQENIE